MAHWPDLSRLAGLPAGGWTPRLLTSRRDARGDRVVIRLDHAAHPAVVLKQSFVPGNPEGMARDVAAQAGAVRALAGHPLAGVPEVLAHLPDRKALLMQAVEGPTLLQAATGDGAAGALRRAGQWLDAFHRAGPVAPRAFQPRFMTAHFAAVAADVRAGTRRVPRRDRFLAHVAALTALAPRAAGAATLSSVRHGDLTARNLILGPQRVWGIDLAAANPGPVGYDIARLLVYLAEQRADPPDSNVIPPRLLAAFFDGYRVIPPDDGTLPFLLRARLLSDWLTMPETRARMTVVQLLRFARIGRLCDAALA
jgi:Ser/Thr protein kinase RdoA (MazF antagonist)